MQGNRYEENLKKAGRAENSLEGRRSHDSEDAQCGAAILDFGREMERAWHFCARSDYPPK